jgi:hypothetical protein
MSGLLWSRNHRRKLNVARVAALCSVLVFSLPAFSVINVCAPKESSPNIKIRTLFNGKPVARATVEIYASSGCDSSQAPLYDVVSDERGVVTLPVLPTGSNLVIACTGQNANDHLPLNVTLVASAGSAEPSKFDMNLQFYYEPSRTQILAWAGQQTVTLHSKHLQGQLVDPAGAHVPGASIELIRRDGARQNRSNKLISGKDGLFFADLPDGDYIALVSSPGFSQKAVPFAIDKKAPFEQLNIELQIGRSY